MTAILSRQLLQKQEIMRCIYLETEKPNASQWWRVSDWNQFDDWLLCIGLRAAMSTATQLPSCMGCVRLLTVPHRETWESVGQHHTKSWKSLTSGQSFWSHKCDRNAVASKIEAAYPQQISCPLHHHWDPATVWKHQTARNRGRCFTWNTRVIWSVPSLPLHEPQTVRNWLDWDPKLSARHIFELVVVWPKLPLP